MKNVTISMDDELLRRSREYAARQGTTLNSLIRQLLDTRVTPGEDRWMEEWFDLADEAKGDSKGWKFDREELHER